MSRPCLTVVLFCLFSVFCHHPQLGAYGSGKGFYEGKVGKAIVNAIRKQGGLMEEADLISHRSTFPRPICVSYADHEIWEAPPNGQGVGALVGLASLATVEKITNKKIGHDDGDRKLHKADTIHSMVECMRLGFSDCRDYVCDEKFDKRADSDKDKITAKKMMDLERITKRVQEEFDDAKANCHDKPNESSCTVSFQVVDGEGNAISFVNSNYMGFGTGIVPAGCGFTLQNRGFGFSLEENHPNMLEPGKRPLHTIIPCLVTKGGKQNPELVYTLSNMGGNMQPQGHMQLVVNLLKYKMDVQSAVDYPRFCIQDGSREGDVYFEDGLCSAETAAKLSEMGHKIGGASVEGWDRTLFGRAQIIQRDHNGVLWCGSDGRCDGAAAGY